MVDKNSEIRTLFDEVLEEVKETREVEVQEFSSNVQEDLRAIEPEIAEYRRRLEEILNSKMEWKDFLVEHPLVGQRVLVWDRKYNYETIAYFDRDSQFRERHNGGERIIAGVRWWMPLQGKPAGAQ